VDRAHQRGGAPERHHLLAPRRTDTNIRYYDDNQLKKLLNVSTLVNGGIRISSVGKLSEKEIEVRASELAEKTSDKDLLADTIVNQLASAGLSYDEVQFEKAFSNAILKYGFNQTYLKIIYPLLMKIGNMWNKSEMIPAQEHFISNLIKQKLFSAIDSLFVPPATAKNWILFLPQGEHHAIGLLYSSYLIRQAGQRSIYLGQDLPYRNLFSAVSQTKADYLLFFVAGKIKRSGLRNYVSKMLADFPNTKILMSGTPQTLKEVEDMEGKNLKLIRSADDLLNLLK